MEWAIPLCENRVVAINVYSICVVVKLISQNLTTGKYPIIHYSKSDLWSCVFVRKQQVWRVYYVFASLFVQLVQSSWLASRRQRQKEPTTVSPNQTGLSTMAAVYRHLPNNMGYSTFINPKRRCVSNGNLDWNYLPVTGSPNCNATCNFSFMVCFGNICAGLHLLVDQKSWHMQSDSNYERELCCSSEPAHKDQLGHCRCHCCFSCI